MGDKTLYYTALERLNFDIGGSDDLEDIGRKLINFMYRDYNFEKPEGGAGRKDGGYDGYDTIKKAKLACSSELGFKSKIKSELEKSKKNSDREMFYFSNQIIPQVEKNKIKQEFKDYNIDLHIFGIEDLSQKLEEYFDNRSDPALFDLLELSSLITGERYRRSEIIPLPIEFNQKIYLKRINIIEKTLHYLGNNNAIEKISKNPLLDYILSLCSEKEFSSFKNISLLGIGYLRKSFLMKMTFNMLIEEFKKKENRQKYQFLPFIDFLELKYYKHDDIKERIKNNIEPLLIFLDGLDELSEANRKDLNDEIQNIRTHNNRVRFIMAGRNSSFFDVEMYSDSVQLYLEKHIDFNDVELINLLQKYKGSPIADFLPIPTYRNFLLEKEIPIDTSPEELYDLLALLSG